MKSIVEYIPLLVLSACIASCGGGGNDALTESENQLSLLADTSDFPLGAEADSAAPPETSIVTVIQTKELDSETDFLFRSSEDLVVTVDSKNSDKIPDRITICRLDEGHQIQVSECLYSGSFNGEYFNNKFSVPNDVESVAVVLWYFEPELEQSVHSWERSDGNDWRIEL